MVREIIHEIYQIKVPLPGNPLKVLNSYLIKGQQRHLLIDTGFNWPECKEAQLNAMKLLGVDWADIDFFITHLHADHSGLVYDLAQPGSVVYCSEIDADLVKAGLTSTYWEITNAFYLKNGFPRKDLSHSTDDHKNWISGGDLNFHYVQDGDIIELGGYRLQCVATPGHSPGHMCLYEPDHKFLIAGDHILGSISSNITSWGASDDFLGLYLASLDKVNGMDIQLVLPGHRDLINDPGDRIAELKHHHDLRLAEIMDILKQGPMNAYQVAGRMKWEVRANNWEEFPRFQRWFATGEAIAHLEHLVALGKVQKAEDSRVIYARL